jgi:hypothetical protein
MTRLKALYRSRGIPCAGKQVYAPRHRAEWLAKIPWDLLWRWLDGIHFQIATGILFRSTQSDIAL